MPDIDLEPTKFRRVFNKPLARPRLLWSCFVIFGGLTALGVWVVSDRPSLFNLLMLMPLAICFGITLAGLFPGYFFNDDRT